jgi:hypothetical protein
VTTTPEQILTEFIRRAVANVETALCPHAKHGACDDCCCVYCYGIGVVIGDLAGPQPCAICGGTGLRKAVR